QKIEQPARQRRRPLLRQLAAGEIPQRVERVSRDGIACRSGSGKLPTERPVIGESVVRDYLGKKRPAQDQGMIRERPFEFDLLVGAKRTRPQPIMQACVIYVTRRN